MMDKKEMDKLRSSTLYKDEELYVVCVADYGNFPKGIKIKATPRFKHKSGLPYPQPKWVVCDYYIYDLDGDSYRVAKERYGELEKGFEWVKQDA